MQTLSKERDCALEKASHYKKLFKKHKEDTEVNSDKYKKYEYMLINKESLIKEIEETNENLRYIVEQLRIENEKLKAKIEELVISSCLLLVRK